VRSLRGSGSKPDAAGPGYVIMPNQAVKGLRERLRRTMLPPCPNAPPTSA